VNVQGEEQKKLDILSDDIMVSSLIASGKCAVLVSEERDDAVIVPEGKLHGQYCVVFDPLDGSRFVSAPPPSSFILLPSVPRDNHSAGTIRERSGLRVEPLFADLEFGTCLRMVRFYSNIDAGVNVSFCESFRHTTLG